MFGCWGCPCPPELAHPHQWQAYLYSCLHVPVHMPVDLSRQACIQVFMHVFTRVFTHVYTQVKYSRVAPFSLQLASGNRFFLVLHSEHWYTLFLLCWLVIERVYTTREYLVSCVRVRVRVCLVCVHACVLRARARTGLACSCTRVRLERASCMRVSECARVHACARGHGPRRRSQRDCRSEWHKVQCPLGTRRGTQIYLPHSSVRMHVFVHACACACKCACIAPRPGIMPRRHDRRWCAPARFPNYYSSTCFCARRKQITNPCAETAQRSLAATQRGHISQARRCWKGGVDLEQ